MSIAFEIDAARKMVFVRVDGAVAFADLCEVEDAMLADPQFDAAFDTLVDIRVVTALPPECATRKLAVDRMARRTNAPLGRVALVAMTRLGLDFATTLELYLDDRIERARVFTDPIAARRWLGCDEMAGRLTFDA